ncbi:MAG: glycosyltransferase family 9 protein, partial [Pyrinomonadaceae bacterium]
MLFDKILVYRIGSIGDTVVALPALWAIRKSFPEARITYLTNGNASGSSVASSLLPKEVYDELIVYSNNFEIGKKLFGKRYDAFFYLMNRNRSRFRLKRDKLFFSFFAKRIYGMKHLEKNSLPMKVSLPLREVESEYNYLLDCLYSENIPSLPRKEELFPDLKLSEDERMRAMEWLNRNCKGWSSKELIGVMVSSGWRSKNWPEKNFVEVLKRLLRIRDVFPIVFGGTKEFEQGKRIITQLGTGAVVAGQLGVRVDAALLERCKLYLGTDTGTMHLAAAVGTKCVVVFSAIDYIGRWVPFGSGHRIIRKRVECEGCLRPE